MTQKSLQRLKSKLWRVNHLYKIKDKNGDLVTFKLNAAQKKYLLHREKHRYNKIIKPRQKGFTTFHCIDMLDDALWIPGSACAILAHERSAVVSIFEIVKRAFDNLHPALKPKTKYDNKNELQFVSDFTGRKLDTKIYVALKLRSGTVTRLHVSEAAYIKNRTELNAGSKQAVAKTGYITEETTGNGFNDFYDEVMKDIESWDKNDGVPQAFKSKIFFYSWFDDDEYELETPPIEDKTEEEVDLVNKYGLSDKKIAWRRWKMNELGKSDKTKLGLSAIQLFKQEYPSNLMEAFQASGDTFFDQDRVEKIEAKEPIEIMPNGLNVWYKPEPHKRYIIGVDPSNGKGLDYASINVWDKKDLKQVAQWHGYIDPFSLADLAAEIGNYYNEALIAVENNLLTTVLQLSKIYTNIYYTIKKDRQTEMETQILGFTTSSKTRPLIIDNFNKLFEDGELEINSAITKSEMRTFIIKDNKRPEHAEGKHDDSLFADFIALEIKDAPTHEVEVLPTGVIY